VEHLRSLAEHVRSEISKVIIGQKEAVDQLLLVLVCGGHAVIEGVPGLAKTLTVSSRAVHSGPYARGRDGYKCV
jgi:MoxR-like ATPase